MNTLDWLPKKHIGGDGGTFFIRYTLAKTPWFAVYLHRFFRGDIDRCLHDHPWPFISVVLKGGYWEVMSDGYHWRRPGSILWRPAKTAHRIECGPGTWSLVVVGRRVRDWGFYTPSGWQKWRPHWSPICETEHTTPSAAHSDE